MDTKFGPGQITNKTPEWAKWMFRITFALTTSVVAWIAATHLMGTEAKYEITLALKLVIDPLMYSISKLFGVNEDAPDN